jgi:hypothetical protein
MDELKVFFRSLDASVVYLSLILVMLLAIKFKLARASHLVVGVCSVPLSFYCFFTGSMELGETDGLQRCLL